MSRLFFVFLISLLAVVNAVEADTIPPVEYEKVQFAGGMEALQQFVSNNLVYPEICRENAVEGNVKVRLYINPLGKVSDIKILEPLDEACNAEVRRVINLMPDWQPAKFDGHPVPSRIVLNFSFRLQV